MRPGSSFFDFLTTHDPSLIRSVGGGATIEAPHGTTIVSCRFQHGVVMAGDRRATMGNIIAQRDIQKVFPADEYSAVGIAGRQPGVAVATYEQLAQRGNAAKIDTDPVNKQTHLHTRLCTLHEDGA